MVELGYKSPDRQNGATLAPIHLVNAGSCPFLQRCCAVSRNEKHCAVLIRSANAAAQLVLRTQAERKAATAAQSGEMKGEDRPYIYSVPGS